MERHGLLAVVVAGLVAGWAGAAWSGETPVSPQEIERLRRLARERSGNLPTIPTLPEIKKTEPRPASQSEVKPTTPALVVSVPQPEPAAPEPEVSAFERYVAAAGPGEMSAGIRQFGYSLFGGAPERFAPPTAVAAGPDYVLGPGDEVLVRIWGKAELEANAFVDREGKISLPKAGAFPVAGKTLRELREQVKAQYDKIFADYGLDVSLGALKSIGVLVVGTVAKPGRYRVNSVATVVNALIEAGGPGKSGSLRAIKVVRAGKEVAAVDLYELLLTGKCSADIRLQPEDTVFVPPVGSRAAVLGGVRVPAIYELGPGEVRLPQLVEMAGGLEATGVAGRVQIERIEGDGRIALSEHNLAAKDAKQLPALKNGDIVRVFQVVKKYANVVYLHGNVARAGAYEFRPGMKVSDLIPGPDALIPEKAWTPGEAPKPLDTAATAPTPDGSGPVAAGSSGPGPGIARASGGLGPVGAGLSGRSAPDAPKPAVSGPDASGSEPPGPAGSQAGAQEEAGQTSPFPEPYWEYALIRRIRQADLSVEYLPFNLRRAVFDKDPAEDKALASQDTVIVFSKWDFADMPVVRVGGAVNRPGTYPLAPGMRLRDLVSIAGGLKPYAYREGVELHRVHYEAGGQRTERLGLSLAEALKGAPAANLELRERDHLFVRSVPEHKDDAMVTVSGEVRFPGIYPIQTGEKLSSLMARAGGYTDQAYLRGAVFLRDSVKKLQQQRLDEMIATLEIELSRSAAAATATGASQEALVGAAEQAQWNKRLMERLRTVKATGRVVVALGPIEELRGSTRDLALEDGDSLAIPSRPGTVNVLGSVYNQTAFLWAKNSTYQHYLQMAGGPTRAADKGATYVVRADGSVVSYRQGGATLRWDGEHKRWVSGRLAGMTIEPGDTVIVPENLEKIAWLREAKDFTQIFYQIAVTTGVMILLF